MGEEIKQYQSAMSKIQQSMTGGGEQDLATTQAPAPEFDPAALAQSIG